MTTTKHSAIKAVKVFSVLAFAGALAGLFAVGNYLMVSGHRPYIATAAEGFVYPIPGKGGNIYVSLTDLAILLGLGAVATLSAICGNWAERHLTGQ